MAKKLQKYIIAKSDPALYMMREFAVLEEKINAIENADKRFFDDPQTKLRLISEVISEMRKMKKGDDGYTPVKGKDYFTDNEISQIISYVQSNVKNGTDGKDGEDGKDADEQKIYQKILNKLEQDKLKEEDVEELTPEQIKGIIYTEIGSLFAMQPKGEKGLSKQEVKSMLNGVNKKLELDFKEIARGLETLTGKDKLDYSALKNTPDFASKNFVKQMRGGGADELTDLKDVSITSPANTEVLAYNSTTAKWENTTAGSGSGDVTAASSFGTDNVLIKSDGTGKGVQATGISVADTTNNVSGLGTLTSAGGTLTIDETASLSDYLQNIVEDTTPQLGGDLDAQGNDIVDLGDITFRTGATGGTLRTGTSAADKYMLQAYDVDGMAYVTLMEADAGNTVELQLMADYLHLEDATDTTKEVTFDISGATTSTATDLVFVQTDNRTITFPDATGTIMLTSAIGSTVQAYDADLDTWAGITPGTGVGTALAVNVGTAGAFVVNGGALGTPSSGTLTNATGLPISTGVSGLGTGVATFLATPSSANLASAVTDETGSGALVFGTNPTIAGATITGVVDAGGATSFEIPNSATPTVDADGEIAFDTTVTDFSTGLIRFFGNEEQGIVSMPIAQFTSPTDGYVVKYNATNDEFELAADSTGSGSLGTNLSSSTNDILSDSGTLVLGGTGNTNNEKLALDFETTANTVDITSSTGVTTIDLSDFAVKASSVNVAGLTASQFVKTDGSKNLVSSTIKDSITIIIDGGGSAITTGAKKVYISAPYDCTLTGWRLVADQSGSIVLDVWKDTYANFPATVADTMIATGTKPTLSTAQKAEDLTIDWATTTLTEGDVMEINVDSITTVTKVILTLFLTRAE